MEETLTFMSDGLKLSAAISLPEGLAPGEGMAVGMAADGGVGECFWLLGRWRGDGRLPGLLAGQICVGGPRCCGRKAF